MGLPLSLDGSMRQGRHGRPRARRTSSPGPPGCPWRPGTSASPPSPRTATCMALDIEGRGPPQGRRQGRRRGDAAGLARPPPPDRRPRTTPMTPDAPLRRRPHADDEPLRPTYDDGSDPAGLRRRAARPRRPVRRPRGDPSRGRALGAAARSARRARPPVPRRGGGRGGVGSLLGILRRRASSVARRRVGVWVQRQIDPSGSPGEVQTITIPIGRHVVRRSATSSPTRA